MANLCVGRMTFSRLLIRRGRRLIWAFGILTVLMCGADTARAGVIFGLTGTGLSGGYRWDADPLTVNMGGTSYERSLDGGLRYSLESGSYEGFRDMFSWSAVPTVDEFVQAIGAAFDAWTALDPVTGLGTALTFICAIWALPWRAHRPAAGSTAAGRKSTFSPPLTPTSGTLETARRRRRRISPPPRPWPR